MNADPVTECCNGLVGIGDGIGDATTFSTISLTTDSLQLILVFLKKQYN